MIKHNVPETELIFTEARLIEYFETAGELLVADTETTGLTIEDAIIMASFYDFILNPVSVILTNVFDRGISESAFVRICSKYLPKFKLIGHNLKFDFGVFKRIGIPDLKLFADTILMLHCYDVDLKKQLEYRIKIDFRYDKPTYKEIIGKNWGKIDWVNDLLPSIEKKTGDIIPALITPENMGEYAAADVYWTGMLYIKYEEKMTPAMDALLTKIEYPLVYTLRDMFLRGVNIDLETIDEIDKKITRELSNNVKEIYAIAGSVFNLNSGPQKAEILYDRLHLKCYKKTKGGARSTDSGVLERLAEEGHEIAEKMVYYSTLQKLQSGYSKSIPLLVDSDGRLRCSFNQEGTRTSRLSSNSPNLQNQPNNPKFPIRKAFVPSDGCKLIVADLSQIEPRIMTHLSKEPKMIELYRTRGDIYIGIAEALGITRKQAKIVQLAISYGIGPDKLGGSLGLTKAGAIEIIEEYYVKYPVFKKWKTGIENLAAKQLCVYTMFGRIRRLPELRNPEIKSLYFGGLRKAVNTSIQSPAADMIKISMTKCANSFTERGMQSKLLLTVHDELVVDAPYNEISEAHRILIDSMENAYPLIVPTIAEAKVCDNWSDMKDDVFISLLPDYLKPKYFDYVWS